MKADLRKELKNLYNAPVKEPVILQVPVMNFLMADGEGNPNTSPRFQELTETLFSVSYTLKFMVKKGEQEPDYAVMPLEGLWWTDDWSAFSLDKKDLWQWTIMIMQPHFISQEMVDAAISQVKKKKGLPGLDSLRLSSYDEGLSAQVMHVGPYAEEGPTVAGLHRFIMDSGYTPAGKHHEIYLSNPRLMAPEKLKTIIRQPVKKAE